jgi:hypothetical protein
MAMAPDWAGGANISRLILLGTPNRGSMDSLRSVVEGYNFVGGDVKRSTWFNKLDAELIFSLPSVYQLLPHSGLDVYVNESLEVAPMDLYDLKTWEANGWSIFSAKHRGRLAKLKEKAQQRQRDEEAFLGAALARARLFHQSLDRSADRPRSFRLVVFGGDCEATLRAPFIATIKGKRVSLFRGKEISIHGRRIDRKRLQQTMFAPGDGRVTRASLLGEGKHRGNGQLFPSALDIDYAVFNCEVHGDLPNNGTLQDNILSILVNDTPAPEEPMPR